MTLQNIKKIDWEYFANRREAALCKSFTQNSYKYFKKATGIQWQAYYSLQISTGEAYYSKKDLEKLATLFLKGGRSVFLRFSRRLVYFLHSFDTFTEKLERKDYSRLSDTNLLRIMNEYVKKALFSHLFLAPMPVADKVLSRIILDLLPEAAALEKQKWLSILSQAIKENEHAKEERSFYKIALVYKYKNKKIERTIGTHLRRFSWIGARWYLFENFWTEGDIRKRLKFFFERKKDPKKELKHLDQIIREKKDEFQKLVRKLHIQKSSELHKFILLAKEYAYLRTYRSDIIYRAGFRARKLFYEIAKRTNFPQSDVIYLTYQEIVNMAKYKKYPVTLQEIEKRKIYFAGVYMVTKYEIFSGRRWEKAIRFLRIVKTSQRKSIRGSVAYNGRAKGRVKLVITTDDILKVKPGDILVAVMTFPHFIAAMEKAAAFVTDEGGILCHAAIVSREMKKPCIIGTKNATKVFKDGDMVEVDAERGIVRKI